MEPRNRARPPRPDPPAETGRRALRSRPHAPVSRQLVAVEAHTSPPGPRAIDSRGPPPYESPRDPPRATRLARPDCITPSHARPHSTPRHTPTASRVSGWTRVAHRWRVHTLSGHEHPGTSRDRRGRHHGARVVAVSADVGGFPGRGAGSRHLGAASQSAPALGRPRSAASSRAAGYAVAVRGGREGRPAELAEPTPRPLPERFLAAAV